MFRAFMLTCLLMLLLAVSMARAQPRSGPVPVERTHVRLSPDGSRIAYFSHTVGRDLLIVAPVQRPMEPDIAIELAGVPSDPMWRGDSGAVLLQIDGELQMLTIEKATFSPVPGDAPELMAISQDGSADLLIQDASTLLRLSGEGEFTPINLPPMPEGIAPAAGRSIEYVSNRKLEPVLALVPRKDGSVARYCRVDEGWQHRDDVPASDLPGSRPIGFDADGTTLWAYDSRGRDTLAVVGVDLVNGQTWLTAEHNVADATAVLCDPATGAPQAVQFDPWRPRWRVLEASLTPDFNALAGLGDGTLDIVDRTGDDACWLVRYESDTSPPTWWLYERAGRTSTFLFAELMPERTGPHAMMRVVRVDADGVALPGLLTLPAGTAVDVTGRPIEPLEEAVILLPPPHTRMRWGWQNPHQAGAAEGKLVLTLHRPGTPGWGKTYAQSLPEPGDLEAAASWLQSQGLVKSVRVVDLTEALQLLGQAP